MFSLQTANCKETYISLSSTIFPWHKLQRSEITCKNNGDSIRQQGLDLSVHNALEMSSEKLGLVRLVNLTATLSTSLCTAPWKYSVSQR